MYEHPDLLPEPDEEAFREMSARIEKAMEGLCRCVPLGLGCCLSISSIPIRGPLPACMNKITEEDLLCDPCRRAKDNPNARHCHLMAPRG